MEDKSLPLITVITPTYKSNPKYLFEAIESVLIQTYPHIEYIITDDGSDNFPEKEIIEYLERNNRGNIRYKIIRNANNIGTVKNLNGALKRAKGDYIFYLAHDDLYYNPEIISMRVSHFQETGALVTIGLVEAVSFDLTTIRGILPSNETIHNLQTMSSKELLEDMWFTNKLIGSTFAFSREYFNLYGLYEEKYIIIEDQGMIYRSLKNDVKIVLWNNIAIRWRVDPTDKLDRYTTNIICILDSINVEKDKLDYFTGLKKILLFLNLQRLKLKYYLLCQSPRWGILFKFIEGFIQNRMHAFG